MQKRSSVQTVCCSGNIADGKIQLPQILPAATHSVDSAGFRDNCFQFVPKLGSYDDHAPPHRSDAAHISRMWRPERRAARTQWNLI
jgi:hypothetical protein